ncbi:MAG: hypothetical protein K1X74_01710 [Pirellulales bacterium]|nr:hypothetical protein [Pirellulales bacterium]
MSTATCLREQIEQDLWDWVHNFVNAKNAFYDYKFPPCPFAKQAIQQKTLAVEVWESGNVREFIRSCADKVRLSPTLTTLVMAFPPRTKFAWGLTDYVESLNAEMICDDVFLNTGEAKTTVSRYPGSPPNEPYFIVIANSLEAVLQGCEALKKTDYYKDWPAEHYALVVERRQRMYEKYGRKPGHDKPR